MAGVPDELLEECIESIKSTATNKGPDNPDEISLQITLKRGRRINGAIPNSMVCIFTDDKHLRCGRNLHMRCMKEPEMLQVAQDMRDVKILVKQYLVFLVSDTLSKKIPPILMRHLKKAEKLPITVHHREPLNKQLKVAKNEVKNDINKVLSFSAEVGDVTMITGELAQNVEELINILLGTLKKNWKSVKTLFLKTKMGIAHRLYAAA